MNFFELHFSKPKTHAQIFQIMSYEHKDWVDGEELTPDALDNIEVGVMSVNSGYVPYDWENGDVVTAERLNHIEDGIANIPDPVIFNCRLTIKNDTSQTINVNRPFHNAEGLYMATATITGHRSYSYWTGSGLRSDVSCSISGVNLSIEDLVNAGTASYQYQGVTHHLVWGIDEAASLTVKQVT